MKKFTDKAIYKHEEPGKTIEKVRGILSSLGFIFTDSTWKHETLDVYSSYARIMIPELEEYLVLGTNGKGIEAEYSLASAYGELMERLQALGNYRVFKKCVGTDYAFLYAPDEAIMCYKDLDDASKEILGVMLRHSSEDLEQFLVKSGDLQMVFVPFWDFTDNRQIMLPVEPLMQLNGSNGLCAGNTPREALAQGISELCERYAMYVEFFDNPQVPVLRNLLFEGTQAEKYIQAAEERGYQCEILDLSLGMELPVIGLRLTGKEGTAVHFGADPNPVIAVLRNFTEIFQGSSEFEFEIRFLKNPGGVYADQDTEEKKRKYFGSFVNTFKSGISRKPDNLFYPSGLISNDYCWNDRNQDDFDYYMELMKKNEMHLLVRDCSFLGFPAYETIIPEMPAINTNRYSRGERKVSDILCNPFQPSVKSAVAAEMHRKTIAILDRAYADHVPEQTHQMLIDSRKSHLELP